MTVFRCLPVAFALLALSCVPVSGTFDPGARGEPASAVATLSEPNRLDRALAASAQGWQFSALLSAGDKRLPMRILARVAGVKEKPGLEAVLLTETGLSLCALSATSATVDVQAALPGSRVKNLCERTGTALQRLILAPWPGSGDAVLSAAERDAASLTDPADHRQKTVVWGRTDGGRLAFIFLRDGALAEKRFVRDDAPQWRALYAGHTREAGLYIPAEWRYVESFWTLRMVMLPSDDNGHGQNKP